MENSRVLFEVSPWYYNDGCRPGNQMLAQSLRRCTSSASVAASAVRSVPEATRQAIVVILATGNGCPRTGSCRAWRMGSTLQLKSDRSPIHPRPRRTSVLGNHWFSDRGDSQKRDLPMMPAGFTGRRIKSQRTTAGMTKGYGGWDNLRPSAPPSG